MEGIRIFEIFQVSMNICGIEYCVWIVDSREVRAYGLEILMTNRNECILAVYLNYNPRL